MGKNCWWISEPPTAHKIDDRQSVSVQFPRICQLLYYVRTRGLGYWMSFENIHDFVHWILKRKVQKLMGWVLPATNRLAFLTQWRTSGGLVSASKKPGRGCQFVRRPRSPNGATLTLCWAVIGTPLNPLIMLLGPQTDQHHKWINRSQFIVIAAIVHQASQLEPCVD